MPNELELVLLVKPFTDPWVEEVEEEESGDLLRMLTSEHLRYGCAHVMRDNADGANPEYLDQFMDVRSLLARSERTGRLIALAEAAEIRRDQLEAVRQ